MYAVGGQDLMLNKPKKSKKKAPRNAFSFYLDEAMKEFKRQGKPVSNKSEAVPLVHETWKNMSPKEKAPYEAKAKEWKMTNRNQPRPGRLDCTGKRIDDRVDFDDFLDKKRKENRKSARSMWPKGFGVCNVHFYIISFKSLFELPDEEGYQPCEVACIDYTLSGGILRTWHHFIDPGPIKMGMRGEVSIFREKTHRIPEANFELACGQYDKMWRELLQFISEDGNLLNFPPLYTRTCELRKTLYCLDWMAARAGIANRLHKVFELEDIAVELFDHAGVTRPSRTTIEDGCSSSMFDYESDTKCNYHDDIECIHCALLVAKKCCYWMSDCLSSVYGFEVTDNHLPVRQAPSYIVTPPERIIIDERPRRSGPRVNPLSKESGYDAGLSLPASFTPDGGSQFGSRDIRYRAQYEIVPHGPATASESEHDNGEGGTSFIENASATSTVTNGIIDSTQQFSDNDLPPPVSMPSCKPSEMSRRPKNKPFANAKVGVMAAQFPKSLKLSDEIPTGPQHPSCKPYTTPQYSGFQNTYAAAAAGTGSCKSASPKDNTTLSGSEANLAQARSIIGLGRGRGKFIRR
uniref:Protein maelstrom homolog n=1 Tax=Phallusia mammillata TaxID=59560 RepID=A0A6F9DKV3_9ASCI|nr:protein maelstrom 2-like [Phallusia mammillata]